MIPHSVLGVIFDSFAQSLEALFPSIDNMFSQGMSDASKVDVVYSSDVSQDVLTLTFLLQLPL